MIIIRLIGGLGNQMFQYAFGRHMAILNETDLKLDITAFEKYKLHKYCLPYLNIKAAIATNKEIRKLKTNKIFRKLDIVKDVHIIEPHHAFNDKMLQLKGSYYLEGYWGTEKYFKEIEKIIRDDFKIKEELLGKNEEIANMIANSNSISLHVRRGDYVSNPKNIKIYNTFGLEYYESAIKYVASKIIEPTFFVFSDDKTWVKNNLKLDFPVIYVDHNFADKNYEDLRLISLCKNNIIANSSFSWWGAWLNNNLDKIVIAPKKFFNDEKLSKNDIVPESWIKM